MKFLVVRHGVLRQGFRICLPFTLIHLTICYEVVGEREATGVRTNATTNESGDYSLPYLVPGPYTVTVESQGFRTFKQTEINLRMDDRIQVGAKLQLGQASQSIEVVAAANMAGTGFSALYIQDDWKVSTKLTVSVGLRHEMPSALTERYNRSVAGFNWAAPNPIAAVTWIYALPLGQGQRWVKSTPVLSTVIGGWQLQGVFTKQSGAPLGFGNAILTCPLSQIPLSGSQRTVSQWFNTACFNRVSGQQLASNLVTVSSLFSGIRGDGIRQFDLSLLKNTRLREGINLEIRAEAYNAFNTPMFGLPNTSSPPSTAFGTVTSQFSYARTIQIALKLLF